MNSFHPDGRNVGANSLSGDMIPHTLPKYLIFDKVLFTSNPFDCRKHSLLNFFSCRYRNREVAVKVVAPICGGWILHLSFAQFNPSSFQSCEVYIWGHQYGQVLLIELSWEGVSIGGQNSLHTRLTASNHRISRLFCVKDQINMGRWSILTALSYLHGLQLYSDVDDPLHCVLDLDLKSANVVLTSDQRYSWSTSDNVVGLLWGLFSGSSTPSE